MTVTTAQLDAEELLHLGLHATQQDDPTKAIELLKQSLLLEPANGKATYLLGALYAQIGMYDRAKEAMTRAVELDQSLSTAAFQLGLLHLTSGHIEQAKGAWSRLDALPQEDCLNLFRQGLIALVEDRFEACAALLERGIDANKLNEALNDDMRRVRESALAAAQGTGAASLPSGPTSSAGTLNVLGNYRNRG